MANAKKQPNQPAEPDALEKRVDAFMDPKKADGPLPPLPKSAADPDPAAPIDIFSDPKTAPQVPADLLKRLKVSSPKRTIAVSHNADVTPGATDVVASKPKPAPAPAAPTPEPVVAEAAPIEAETTPADQAETPDTDQWVGPRTASQPPTINLEDSGLDAAITDIANHEGDELLAAQDAAAKDAVIGGPKKPSKRRFKFNLSGKKWWLLGAVLLLVILAAAWPTSRYKAAGLMLHKQVSLHVVDATAGTPVSDSTVSLGGTLLTTDSSGNAHLKLPVGKHNLLTTKKYYQTNTQSVFVGFRGNSSATIRLVATGRQVPITVNNALTGKPLAGVSVSASGTSAKTNSRGQAVIVVPAGKPTLSAKLSGSGYNTKTIAVTVTASVVKANTFTVTPSGHIYFLSNSSGKIDVVKANLDGTGRSVELAGTGHENENGTQLLASPDWQYLALKASRDSSQTGLYLIDTTTGKVTEFDASDSDFTMVGWSGDSIVYDAVKATVPASTNAHEVLKSYNAANAQLNQLDASAATGTASDYAYNSFGNFNLISNQLFYTTQWYVSGNGDDTTKSDTIRGLTVGGSAAKDFESVPATTFGYWQSAQTGPQTVSFAAFDSSDNKSTYYKLSDGAVSVDPSGSAAIFNQDYPAYRQSPNGKQVFWSALRDGQNMLFTADANGQNQQSVASSGRYTAYGWYGSYLLLSKSGSQLYVSSSSSANAALKVADYYQPADYSGTSNYQIP